jgi:hypothetical protein
MKIKKSLMIFVVMVLFLNVCFGTTITAFAAAVEEAYCNQIAHTHTEKCYDEGLTQLVCGMTSHSHEECAASVGSVWNGMKNSKIRAGKKLKIYR